VAVAYSRSVPTAVGAGTPIVTTRKGVIKEPPPTPVRPTRKPTSRPKRTGSGSITPGDYAESYCLASSRYPSSSSLEITLLALSWGSSSFVLMCSSGAAGGS
jgi:hypothetical protein